MSQEFRGKPDWNASIFCLVAVNIVFIHYRLGDAGINLSATFHQIWWNIDWIDCQGFFLTDFIMKSYPTIYWKMLSLMCIAHIIILQNCLVDIKLLWEHAESTSACWGEHGSDSHLNKLEERFFPVSRLLQRRVQILCREWLWNTEKTNV